MAYQEAIASAAAHCLFLVCMQDVLPTRDSGEPMSREFILEYWRWDVFVCHAGPNKDFARLLGKKMRDIGLRCFVDEDSLRIGGNAHEDMQAAAKSTHIAVVLLCKEFFKRDAPKRELGWFLKECDQDRNKVIPVFFRITVEECEELAREFGLEAVTGIAGLRHIRERDNLTGEPVHVERTMHRIIENVARMSCLPKRCRSARCLQM